MVQNNSISVCSRINRLHGAEAAALATVTELCCLGISFYLSDTEIFHV